MRRTLRQSEIEGVLRQYPGDVNIHVDVSSQDGIAVNGSGDGKSELLVTGDGGRTWRKVPITDG